MESGRVLVEGSFVRRGRVATTTLRAESEVRIGWSPVSVGEPTRAHQILNHFDRSLALKTTDGLQGKGRPMENRTICRVTKS